LGAFDNFFESGAHSLLMVRVHALLCERLGRKFPLVLCFQHPTIRSLAQALEGTATVENQSRMSAARDRAQKARTAMARHPLLPSKQ
jgi:hypothetical protein